MMGGMLVMSLGVFFIGVTEIFGFKDDILFSFAGMCMVGLAAGLISIPVVPEMLQSVEENPDLNFDPQEVNNRVSSLNVVLSAVGEAVGPIASSLLLAHFGF